MSRLPRAPGSVLSALAVLAVGLLADFAFTTPEMEKYQTLSRRQAELETELQTLQTREAELGRWARSLGYRSMAGALDSLATQDPITFLTEAVTAARLSRGELATRSTQDVSVLRRTQFLLVVRGPFERVHGLLHELESGSRTITIDGVSMTPLGPDDAVEARINLSIYDPRRNGVVSDGS